MSSKKLGGDYSPHAIRRLQPCQLISSSAKPPAVRRYSTTARLIETISDGTCIHAKLLPLLLERAICAEMISSQNCSARSCTCCSSACFAVITFAFALSFVVIFDYLSFTFCIYYSTFGIICQHFFENYFAIFLL